MKNSLSSERRKHDCGDVLVIGISSRALFDLRESHDVYDAKGLVTYAEYQVGKRGRIPGTRSCLSAGQETSGPERG